MVLAVNIQLFYDFLAGGTPLGVSLSQREQIWCLYRSFISFRGENIIDLFWRNDLRSYGPIHNSGHLEYR